MTNSGCIIFSAVLAWNSYQKRDDYLHFQKWESSEKRYISGFCDFTFRCNFQYVWYNLLQLDVDLRQQKSASVFWRKKLRFWMGMFRKLKSRSLRSMSKNQILGVFLRDDVAATSAWRSVPSLCFFLRKSFISLWSRLRGREYLLLLLKPLLGFS